MAETGRVLRLGRTKMYALVSEWRRTGGASGLRVVDFGDALRVPRHAVEELVGGPIHVPTPACAVPTDPTATSPTLGLVANDDMSTAVAEPSSTRARRPSRRGSRRPADQLDLFEPPAAS